MHRNYTPKYLLLFRWEVVLIHRVKGMHRQLILIHPLTEVIGQVEASVVVGAVLEVDEADPVMMHLSVCVEQDVALLHVVVGEHHWRLYLGHHLSQIVHFLVVINLLQSLHDAVVDTCDFGLLAQEFLTRLEPPGRVREITVHTRTHNFSTAGL